MPIRPHVPATLKTGPFTFAEATCEGVTRAQLRGASYRQLGAGLYRWAGLAESPQLLLNAVARRLPEGAAFSGLTAAWLHGLSVDPCDPIEVTIPKPLGSDRRAGASVRCVPLAASEILTRRGLPATSPLRTVVDLGGRRQLVEGVVAADLFLHAGLVSGLELQAYVAEHRRAKGIARLRQVIDLAESKTESPMETRLRMLLVLGGLPRPEVQVPLIGKHGEFLGRADLLYSDHRLVLEYDGFNHRERLVDDDRRQNRIVDAGFQILRFTAPDVYRDPESVLIRVRHSLGLPGLRHMRVNGRFAVPRYSQRGGYVD